MLQGNGEKEKISLGRAGGFLRHSCRPEYAAPTAFSERGDLSLLLCFFDNEYFYRFTARDDFEANLFL